MKTRVKIITNPTTEAQHQHNVIAWSEIHLDQYPELCLLHHIPNGGAREEVEAAHLKDAGVKAGVPDLCLPVARGRYHGLYVEMKKPGGTESHNQIWWRERLTEQGYYATVAYGWSLAVGAIERYLNLKEAQP